MKLFNGYVLGTSGGGKSFDVKVRKADDFAFDEPIVIDPEKLGVDVAAKCINGRCLGRCFYSVWPVAHRRLWSVHTFCRVRRRTMPLRGSSHPGHEAI